MLYTYDITDVKTGEIVARDITKRKVLEVLGVALDITHYVEDLVLCKGRYRISRNQVIKESAEKLFALEWRQAIQLCKQYPHLDQIKITMEK